MPKSAYSDIASLRNQVLALENFLFRSPGPIKISKITVDSDDYDCAYESKIRKRELNLICALEELMRLRRRRSNAWSLLNELENHLMSPEFYRSIIFGRRGVPEVRLFSKFKKSVFSEASYLKENLTADEYKTVIKSLSGQDLPDEKDEFILALELLAADGENIH